MNTNFTCFFALPFNFQEFAYVSTKLAYKAGGYGSYTDVDQAAILAGHSGLLNYLFGKNRDKPIDKAAFKKLQQDLLEEIVHVEFDEYDKEKTGRISEEDFCKFLLKKSKVPPAQKARMLKRVKQIWPSKARGVSFASFKNFFMVLTSGSELERGLFFLDVENIGVDLEEFRKVASWVSGGELSDHIAEVVFVLLDDQGQGRYEFRTFKSLKDTKIQMVIVVTMSKELKSRLAEEAQIKTNLIV